MKALKAFDCWLRGYESEPSIRLATTASKARAAYWRDLRDCCPDLKIHQVKVRRSPGHDMTFPDMSPAVASLSEGERAVLLHAFGGGDHIAPERWGYRDHYCCSHDNPTLNNLVRRGFMTGPHGTGRDDSSSVWVGNFFYLTEAGKIAARALIGVRETR